MRLCICTAVVLALLARNSRAERVRICAPGKFES